MTSYPPIPQIIVPYGYGRFRYARPDFTAIRRDPEYRHNDAFLVAKHGNDGRLYVYDATCRGPDDNDLYLLPYSRDPATPGRWRFLRPEAISTGGIVGAICHWVSTTTVKVGDPGVRSVVQSSDRTGILEWDGELYAVRTASGIGGLDTGVWTPSTWYAVMVVGSRDGYYPPALMFTKNYLAPTLPPDYDIFRRVGWARAKSATGNIRKFKMFRNGTTRLVGYDEERAELQALAAGTATAYTSVSVANFVPPTGCVFCAFAGFDSQTSQDYFQIRPTGSTVVIPFLTFYIGLTAPVAVSAFIQTCCGTNRQIDYRVNNNNNSKLDLYVGSYEDEI